MKITDAEIEWKDWLNGERAVIKFKNGYAASCLRGGGLSYTKNGTYEIAVLDKEGNVDYSTPVTSDVLGYLSEEEANKALADIEALT